MTKQNIRIIETDATHAAIAAPLLDAYRQFYKKPSDLDAAFVFLSERLKNEESVLFLAFLDSGSAAKPVGFVHLYPTFSSLTLRKQWILYDLFVAHEARRRGIGEALMNRARQLAKETGADSLILETAKDNFIAQGLYERLGYIRDEVFYRYSLQI